MADIRQEIEALQQRVQKLESLAPVMVGAVGQLVQTEISNSQQQVVMLAALIELLMQKKFITGEELEKVQARRTAENDQLWEAIKDGLISEGDADGVSEDQG